MHRLRQSEWEQIREHVAQKYGAEQQSESKPAPLTRVGVCRSDGCERLAHPDGSGLCAGCYRRERGR